MATLTGKKYTAKIELSHHNLAKLREHYGDIEDAFRAATGYGYDALPESEARYIAGFKPVDAVRNRILAGREPARRGDDAGAAAAPGLTATLAFLDWFKDSQVCDAQGAPLVVYHGTNADFSAFAPGDTAWTDCIFFTSSADVASNIYAGGQDQFNAVVLRARLATMSDAQLAQALEAARKRVRGFDYYENFEDDFIDVRDELAGILEGEFEPAEGIGQKVDRVMEALGVAPRAATAGANVIPAYLSLQNPLRIDAKGDTFDHECKVRGSRRARLQAMTV
ncbi:MAG: hypothetical protein K2X55_30370 [Burkholderiaceae bacterium]|nr:hypothetical protein [Burkholderiaceae bacterium]